MTNKTSVVLVLFCLLLKLNGYSQDFSWQTAGNDTASLNDLYIDFSIPDLSAFSLLGTNPNQINKPSTVKEFSASVLNFNSLNKINPAVALEWAPFMSFKSNQKSIDEYRKNYWWKYSFQITAGSTYDSLGTNTAIGVRWVVIDKSNPLLSSSYQTELFQLLGSTQHSIDDIQKNFIEYSKSIAKIIKGYMPQIDNPTFFRITDTILNSNAGLGDSVNIPIDTIAKKLKLRITKVINSYDPATKTDPLSSKLSESLDSVVSMYLKFILVKKERSKSVNEELKKLKVTFKNDVWNATKLQFAGGYTANSTDGSWSNLTPKDLVIFGGWCFPIGKIKEDRRAAGQGIVHLQGNINLNSEDSIESKLYGGFRFLYGTNESRISLESALTNESSINNSAYWLRFTVGGEIKVAPGLWLEIATGFNQSLSEELPSIPTVLGSVKYALQKKRRFEI
jgi:hypothetical protein